MTSFEARVRDRLARYPTQQLADVYGIDQETIESLNELNYVYLGPLLAQETPDSLRVLTRPFERAGKLLEAQVFNRSRLDALITAAAAALEAVEAQVRQERRLT